MSHDPVFTAFLARQFEEGMALASASDLLELTPSPGDPPTKYLARFRCKGLVRKRTGEIVEADDFRVGIWFPPEYLRRAEPWEVVTWLGPTNVHHPNISDRAPFICLGRLYPGTPLRDILFQVFEIVSFQKVTMREDDALNVKACVWARDHQARFPIDRRPLLTRAPRGATA